MRSNVTSCDINLGSTGAFRFLPNASCRAGTVTKVPDLSVNQTPSESRYFLPLARLCEQRMCEYRSVPAPLLLPGPSCSGLSMSHPHRTAPCQTRKALSIQGEGSALSLAIDCNLTDVQFEPQAYYPSLIILDRLGSWRYCDPLPLTLRRFPMASESSSCKGGQPPISSSSGLKMCLAWLKLGIRADREDGWRRRGESVMGAEEPASIPTASSVDRV
jgi:hypothetical protein